MQPANSPYIFNRALLARHRSRAARNPPEGIDFLWRECADRLVDKLADINRRFPVALDLGCHHGGLKPILLNHFGIETVIQTDAVSAWLNHATPPKLVMDEEWLAFKENSVNLVISLGSLHWVNDLPGTLKQIYHILKPDGLFLCMIPGGETLIELRSAMVTAMEITTGGISPRLSPMVDVPDAGALLQRAGFVLPVVDREFITVEYSHPLKLLHDLRGMGQTNALRQRATTPLTRQLISSIFETYTKMFGQGEEIFPATFDILTLMGWKPLS